MTAIWLTADLHLGHEFVAKMRGFDNSAHHDWHVETQWLRRVKPTDDVFVLGDFALGGWRDHINPFSHWPGRKHLILGNHDRAHPMHRNSHKYVDEFLAAFDSVQLHGSVRHSGRTFLLSHFPYDGDHVDEGDRYSQWRLRDVKAPLIHGHTHSPEKVSRSHEYSYQVCVSLDAWNMAPVSLGEVAALVPSSTGP